MNPRQCLACPDVIAFSKHEWADMRPSERRYHRVAGRSYTGGRGLCKPCWEKARQDGTLINFERPTVPRELVLKEYQHVADHYPGESRKSRLRRLAPRLGMTFEAAERALVRAAHKEAC